MRFVFVFLLIPFVAGAQDGPIKVYYKSRKVVSTAYVYLFSGYSSSYLRIHEKKGEKIDIGLIDHIEGTDESGNTRYFVPIETSNLSTVWAERGFMSDRITIYHTDIVTGKMAASYKPKNCLYSKDGSNLKPLKLKYLKEDLADCPESLVHLRKGKRVVAVQAAVCVASYALVIAGSVQFITDASGREPGDGSPGVPPIVFLGAIGAWTPLIIGNLKRERYLDALKAYH